MTDLHKRIGELSPARRELLERLMREKGVAMAGLAIRPTPRTSAEQPLSFAQRRLWFFEQLAPGTSVYNVFDSIAFDTPVEPELVERSLNEIVCRHEVLRTTFAARRGQPFQVVVDSQPLSLSVFDLRALPSLEREARAKRVADKTARQPFDLTRGPLLRAALLRSDAGDTVLLCMHHIISDAWSLEIFEKELRALCAASAAGHPSPLPLLAIQYADYAAWQREVLEGEELASQLSYWKEQLTGAPTVLELPTARARPPAPSYRGATQWHRLPTDLGRALRTFSRTEGATPFMVTLAAFAVVLWRYTDQTDFVIGTPVTGRTRAETEPLIGFFVNTLALRADLSGDPPFRDLLKRVRQACVGGFAHQDVPFEMVVEAVHPARDPSRNPLFQVSFQFSSVRDPLDDAAAAAPELSDDRTLEALLGVEESVAKFDLSINIWDDGHTARVQADYSTDLFEDAMISRLLRHLEGVLRSATERPGEPISRLPLEGKAERRQVLESWNDTATPFPSQVRLETLFAQRVAETPDALAIQTTHEQLTYADLNARADRLQRVLNARGVGAETIVGLLMERSVGMVVGMLGILKAGGAYAPLDPEYPSERLALMVGTSGIEVVVTERRFASVLPAGPTTVVLVDGEDAENAGEDAENAGEDAENAGEDAENAGEDAENAGEDVTSARSAPAGDEPIGLADGGSLAYVITTSGSTGTPKGVAITHQAVARTVCNTNYFTIDAADRVAMASNPSFDAATFEVWGALLHGAALVVVPKASLIVPERLAEVARSARISVMFLTTALLNQVAACAPAAFASVRCLLFGGEAVDPRRVREILRAGPPARLLHMYGPTESTTFATWHLVEAVAADAVTIPIGAPLSNTQVYLLDRHLEAVPVGVPGELYIGGAGLARAYVNEPAATAERFVPNPFGSEPGGRLYRTGDLARYRSDGAIEFIGRRDHQVKLRGYRIELGEVEAVVRAHPSVREVLAVCADDPRGDKRLVAYTVPRPGAEVSNGELRAYMRRRVPDYLVPSSFVMLTEMPLTPNGKIDRRALPDPEEARREAGVPSAPPRTPTERAVATIFAKVLRLDGVGRDESFFDLGGHSLLATQIVARVSEAFGVEVPLRALFNAPTVEGFAAAVSELLTTATETLASAIPALDRERYAATRTSGGQLVVSEELRGLLRDDVGP